MTRQALDYHIYLAQIGAKGGKVSKRKLTKKDAKAMAEKRWGKLKQK